MRINQKYILIITVGLIILVAVLIYPSGIDTSQWLTHREEAFGFEIKYPKDAGFRVSRGGTILRLHSENSETESARIYFDFREYLNIPVDLIQEKDKAVGGVVGFVDWRRKN